MDNNTLHPMLDHARRAITRLMLTRANILAELHVAQEASSPDELEAFRAVTAVKSRMLRHLLPEISRDLRQLAEYVAPYKISHESMDSAADALHGLDCGLGMCSLLDMAQRIQWIADCISMAAYLTSIVIMEGGDTQGDVIVAPYAETDE